MTKNTKGYNGYKNYAQWNQSLWLNNDEGLYLDMVHFVRVSGSKAKAANSLYEQLVSWGNTHTPDGVKWSKAGIRAAMSGL